MSTDVAGAPQEGGNANAYLGKVMANSDVAIAGAVVGIVVMMIIPLPTWLLDILLTFNLSLIHI